MSLEDQYLLTITRRCSLNGWDVRRVFVILKNLLNVLGIIYYCKRAVQLFGGECGWMPRFKASSILNNIFFLFFSSSLS